MGWKELDRLIDEFQDLSRAGTGMLGWSGRTDWRAIWSKATEIQNGFESTRYPTAAQRNEAWQRFQQLRTDASSRAKREKQEHRWTSDNHFSDILHQIECARPHSLFGFDPPDAEEMKAPRRKLSEASRMLSERKQEMLREHKDELFSKIQEMQQIHNGWWEQLKQHRENRRRWR